MNPKEIHITQVISNAHCSHPNIRPEVFDQTLGVLCPDCPLSAACWSPEHCPESLWNLACKNDSDCVSTEQSREDVCGICGDSGLVRECLTCHLPFEQSHQDDCRGQPKRKHSWQYITKEDKNDKSRT